MYSYCCSWQVASVTPGKALELEGRWEGKREGSIDFLIKIKCYLIDETAQFNPKNHYLLFMVNVDREYDCSFSLHLFLVLWL